MAVAHLGQALWPCLPNYACSSTKSVDLGLGYGLLSTVRGRSAKKERRGQAARKEVGGFTGQVWGMSPGSVNRIQDKFDHDKGQKSAISGRRLHWRLSTGSFAFFQVFMCNLVRRAP